MGIIIKHLNLSPSLVSYLNVWLGLHQVLNVKWINYLSWALEVK